MGFLVRPFGALFFGRIGDLVGRKYAFLVTLSIMGFSTLVIGLLPTFATAGWFAPIVLILIRVLQGLALGGEYGGAAVYVGEHVPDNKRGFYTSFIQITATLGLVRFADRDSGDAEFDVEGRLLRVWLANSVPDLDFAGGHLAVHSAEDEGVADLRADQERGHGLDAAAEGRVHASGRI